MLGKMLALLSVVGALFGLIVMVTSVEGRFCQLGSCYHSKWSSHFCLYEKKRKNKLSRVFFPPHFLSLLPASNSMESFF